MYEISKGTDEEVRQIKQMVDELFDVMKNNKYSVRVCGSALVKVACHMYFNSGLDKQVMLTFVGQVWDLVERSAKKYDN